MNSVWVPVQNGVHPHSTVDEVGTHDTSSLPEELQAIMSAGRRESSSSVAQPPEGALAQVKDPSTRSQATLVKLRIWGG